MVVVAVRAQYRLTGEPSPVGKATARVLAGFRRTGAERSRGPATGVRWGQADAAAAVAANGSKSTHGLRDGAIVAVGSAAMLRVSELSALRWRDIEADGEHTITLRRSKTDQEGAGVTLFIGEPTVALLEAWREALVGIGGDTGPDAPVFVRLHKGGQRAGSKPISGTALRAIIARRCADAGRAPRSGVRLLSPSCAGQSAQAWVYLCGGGHRKSGPLTTVGVHVRKHQA